jgi:hypothetical protein
MKKNGFSSPILGFLLLAGAFSMCVLACWRDDWAVSSRPGFIAGHIYEFGTNKPVVGATVKAFTCDGEAFGSLGCTVLDSANSDAEGHYRIEGIDDNAVLFVNAYKDSYFTDDLSQSVVLNDKEDKTNVVLYPHAWLQVTIRNESGAYAFNTDVFDPLNPFIYLENGDSRTYTTVVKGNQDYRFGYCVKPSPDTLMGCTWASIFCPGHDTAKLNINY